VNEQEKNVSGCGHRPVSTVNRHAESVSICDHRPASTVNEEVIFVVHGRKKWKFMLLTFLAYRLISN